MDHLTLWAFDVNGTLDYGRAGAMIDSRAAARLIRAEGGWFGTASGLSPWRQLRLANDWGVQLDFAVHKFELWQLAMTVQVQLSRPVQLVLVGDNPHEDPLLARMALARFVWAEEFRLEAGYIRRLSGAGPDLGAVC